MIYKNTDMIEGMGNPYDYDEYVKLCKQNNVAVRDLSQFAHGLGMLMVGRNRYPDLNWRDAYTKMIGDVNNQDKAECCEDKPSPSKLQQAKNLVRDTTIHAANGFKEADDYKDRMLICRKCSEFRRDEKCSQCGCYMKIKAKWAAMKCPLKKW